MRKMFLIITLVVAGLMAKAQYVQKKDIPSDVTSALSHKYSNIDMNKVHWNREGNNYKAKFSRADKDYKVLFDKIGKWITTDVEDLSFAELPKDVQKELSKKGYNSDKLKDVEMSETPDDISYKLKVKDSNLKFHDIYMDKEGKVLMENI